MKVRVLIDIINNLLFFVEVGFYELFVFKILF